MSVTAFKKSPTDESDPFGFPDEVNAPSWNEDSTEGDSWGFASSQEQGSSSRRSVSVSLQDIAEFTSQLAIMTRSGVDIASALASLAKQCQRPALTQVLQEVHESVLAGTKLSEALRSQTHVFDPSFVASVAAGEASGNMSDVLNQLAKMQQNSARSRRSIKAMMTYPVLLLCVSGAVIVALVLFVLPRFADIFEQYEIALPAITQVLIAIASEFRSRWWLWLPVAVGIPIGICFWKKTDHGRLVLDTIWIHSPVLQKATRSHAIARTCQLLGLMLQSGVPLLESLKLTQQAIGNTLYRALLADSEDAVLNGRSLSSVWENAEVVPDSAREMIITAERTGNLAEVTSLLGEYYEEEAEASTRQLVGLLEPIITVGMGLIVAIIVLAVMLPVFDLSTLSH